MNIRAVIFDVDGTIVDNHEAHEEAWFIWCERHGVRIDHALYQERLYARPNEIILRALLGEQITDQEILGWATEKETIYRELYTPRMVEMPGLSNVLALFAANGVVCGVASNAERVNVDFVVDGLNLRPHMKVALAREDVAHAKPDPELFLTAARLLDCEPERCAVFEDSPTGFEAARRAGMPCVAITGHSRGGVLPPHVCDAHRDFTTVSARDVLRLSAPH